MLAGNRSIITLAIACMDRLGRGARGRPQTSSTRTARVSSPALCLRHGVGAR